MSLVLITPPSVEPVTLAEAKEHLRVFHADDDIYIGKLIAAARQQVEARTCLRLITQVWRHGFHAWPKGLVLDLSLSPIINVLDLKVFDADDVSVTIDPAHYQVDVADGRVAIRPERAVPFPARQLNGIEVSFTAGFGLADAVPQELKQALLLIVGNWFAHRGEAGEPVSSLIAEETLRTYRVRRIA